MRRYVRPHTEIYKGTWVATPDLSPSTNFLPGRGIGSHSKGGLLVGRKSNSSGRDGVSFYCINIGDAILPPSFFLYPPTDKIQSVQRETRSDLILEDQSSIRMRDRVTWLEEGSLSLIAQANSALRAVGVE